MAKNSFKCPKCDKAFSMAAHLGRHMSTIHASPQQKAAAKKKGKKSRVAGRPKAIAKPIGRPKGVTTRLDLQGMTIDQLAEVITAARAEAQRRIAELQQSLG